MSLILFNFQELVAKSDNDSEGIIILLYASNFDYNKCICSTTKYLLRTLNLTRCPSSLFQNKCLSKSRGWVTNTYKVSFPTSYLSSKNVLTYKCAVGHKINYIKLISKRRITDSNKYIDSFLVEEDLSIYKSNPLLHITTDKIHFIGE